jgi:WD40 repeat protein/serine/threonine protein kinase
VSQSNGEQSFADLLEEATRHLQRDGAVDLEALLRAHPQYADQLRELLPAMAAMAIWGQSRNGVEEQRSSGVEPPVAGVLGDFRIIREIGRGGMGVVYEAEQLSLRRRVALKVLPFAAVLDRRSLQRFKNEALAAASLDHPNIVSVYFVGEERGVHFFAMQLVHGQTLAEVVGEMRAERGVGEKSSSGVEEQRSRGEVPSDGRTSPLHLSSTAADTGPVAQLSTLTALDGREYFRAVARLGVEAARALQHAHDQGVVHRDIKPGNLMLDSDGQLYIADFGLARIETDVTMTMTGDLLGTLRYMAPEQGLGQRRVIDHRADVYSLGATLYELLALVPAFGETDRSELLKRIAFDEPRALRKHDRRIPAELETIVLKAMAKQSDDRYQTAGELAEDLQRFLEHKPIVGKPPSRLERCLKWSRRHPAWAALFAVVSLGLIALSAGAMWHARTLSAALYESEHHRSLAQRSEKQALEREASLQRSQYAMNVALARDSLKTGHVDFARQLLAHYKDDARLSSLRGFEWYYLWNLYFRQADSQVLGGHQKMVSGLAYSPNDKLLATASEDGTVQIWETDSYRLLKTLKGHSSCVNRVVFSPDGTWIATAGCDKTVKVWDAKTFLETASFPHEDACFGLAISPDGMTLAAGQGDGVWGKPANNDIVLWELTSGKRKLTLSGHEDDIYCLAFSPDGKFLVTGSVDRSVRRWDVVTGRQLNIVHHRRDVTGVTYSCDGSSVVSGSNDGHAIVWDQENWRPKKVLQSNEAVGCIAISSDGATLATGNRGGLIQTWDLATGMPKHILLTNDVSSVNGRKDITALAFRHNGHQLASGAPTPAVRVWDLSNEPGVDSSFEIVGSGSYASFAFDTSLTNLFAADRRWTVDQWRLTGGSHTRLRPYDSYSERPPSGKVLAVAPSGRVLAANATSAPPGHLEILEAGTGKRVATLADERGSFIAAEFIDDTTLLGIVKCGLEPPTWSASLWDITTGRLQHRLHPYESAVTAFATNAGKHVFAVCDGPNIKISNASTGQLLSEFDSDAGKVEYIAFSPDGNHLAIAGIDGTIRMMDWANGTELRRLFGENLSVRSITFSPDGRTLVSGDDRSMLRLWNIDTGIEMIRLPAQYSEVGTVQFSADGKRLACLSIEPIKRRAHEVRIWSIER